MPILDTEKVLVPNWFKKEHLEHFLGRKVSDKYFQEAILHTLETNLCDWISAEMRDWIHLNDEFIKERCKE